MAELSDIDATRLGLMEVMVGAMTYPVGTFDDRSVIEFVRCALKLHAWCIREELYGALGETGNFDQKVLARLKADATKQRVQHAIRLTNYAMFMSAERGLIRNAAITH